MIKNFMERGKLILLFILFACNEIFAHNYEGYKVFKVYADKTTQQKVLEKLHSTSEFDFWTSHKHLKHPTIIMVNPNVMDKFHTLMKKDKINYKEMINNVGRFLDHEHVRTSKECGCKEDGTISFCKYHSYKTIKSYLENLHKKYPRTIGVFSIGRTIEGRDIMAVRIPNDRQEDEQNKPSILIDAGIHAREWISPATALYLINQLVEHYYNADMYKSVNWYILPLMNPDGYEYSQKWDRLWRKSRAKGKYCYGVDINRNFNFHWLEGGSSSDECSETYAGPRPFSEPESISFRNFVLKNKNNIKLYVTLHSYGNYILYPWNYMSKQPEDENELKQLARQVGEAMERVNGNQYSIGSSGTMLYKASGNSEDWAKGIAGIQLSFAIELPGGGETGFDVPEMFIDKVGREMFAGFKIFQNYVKKKWNTK